MTVSGGVVFAVDGLERDDTEVEVRGDEVSMVGDVALHSGSKRLNEVRIRLLPPRPYDGRRIIWLTVGLQPCRFQVIGNQISEPLYAILLLINSPIHIRRRGVGVHTVARVPLRKITSRIVLSTSLVSTSHLHLDSGY